MAIEDIERRFGILHEISEERVAQLRKWGVQRHPDGTGGEEAAYVARLLKELCQSSGLAGGAGDTWVKILAEEISEAFDEIEWSKVRRELVQSAAVIVAWLESGDEKEGRTSV